MLTERIERVLQHENVAIHCNAGVGRTAVVAGCLLRRLRDYSSEEAMSIIREHMQIRITSEQARFVEKFPAQQSTSWRA
jgi:protein-tyrosine phosphatase